MPDDSTGTSPKKLHFFRAGVQSAAEINAGKGCTSDRVADIMTGMVACDDMEIPVKAKNDIIRRLNHSLAKCGRGLDFREK
jgi:hypothetical protein